jgi:hypothetical protein
MVDLALLQSVSYIAGALGVCVAAAYYVMNLRLSQKNQELTLKTQELALKTQQQNLETRQAQLYMNIFDSLLSVNTIKDDYELMEYKWKDYDDFENKYGPKNDLDGTAKRQSLHSRLDNVGWLVKCGVVDPEWAYNQIGGLVLFHWVKFKPIFFEERRRDGWPNYYENFEYLAGVCDSIGRNKGLSSEVVKGHTKWIPEDSSVNT